MRTWEEIRRRLEEICDRDLFGFESQDLIGTLPFEELPAMIAATPNYSPEGIDRESVIGRMRDYMPFALSKAVDHRGLSASRSISHFRAWTWLLGDEDFGAINWDRYGPYGVPILRQLCERYELKHEFSGSLALMSVGKPCEDACAGCTG